MVQHNCRRAEFWRGLQWEGSHLEEATAHFVELYEAQHSRTVDPTQNCSDFRLSANLTCKPCKQVLDAMDFDYDLQKSLKLWKAAYLDAYNAMEKAEWDALHPTENEAAPKRKRKKKKKAPAPEDTEPPERSAASGASQPAMQHEDAAEADATLRGLGHAAAAGAADSTGCGRQRRKRRASPSPSPAGAAASAASEEPRRRRMCRRRRRERSPSPGGAVAGRREKNSATGRRCPHQPDRGGGRGGDDHRLRVSVGTAVLVGGPYAHLPPPPSPPTRPQPKRQPNLIPLRVCAARRRAASGASQPAVADATKDGDVTELHRTLREVEEADDISPDVRRELGKILFKKITVTNGGVERQYVASRAETINTIKKLLQRRKDFMAARGLHDGPSHIVGGRYLFTQQDRHQVMKDWKKEFHAAPEQVEQQKRDSWQPQRRPVDGNWGPNTAAVRHGMHLRFAQHLQLEAGSKARTSGSPLETHVAMWP